MGIQLLAEQPNALSLHICPAARKCHTVHTLPNLSTILARPAPGSPRRRPGDGGTTDGRSVYLPTALENVEQLQHREASAKTTRGGREGKVKPTSSVACLLLTVSCGMCFVVGAGRCRMSDDCMLGAGVS